MGDKNDMNAMWAIEYFDHGRWFTAFADNRTFHRTRQRARMLAPEVRSRLGAKVRIRKWVRSTER
jgi:hypothetical protein